MSYPIISAAFCVIVVISNILSAKLVDFGYVVIPAGLITYPLSFILSDLVNEIFGPQKTKVMVYTAFGMTILSFGLIRLILALPTQSSEDQQAFQTVMGLSGLRIFSSLTAYFVAHMLDVQLYAMLKRWTGLRFLWLRNNGSTWVSQLVDTVIIDMIFLYWGLRMGMSEILPIMGISFAYKALFSAINTPVLYVLVYMMRKQWSGISLSWLLRRGVSR